MAQGPPAVRVPCGPEAAWELCAMAPAQAMFRGRSVSPLASGQGARSTPPPGRAPGRGTGTGGPCRPDTHPRGHEAPEPDDAREAGHRPGRQRPRPTRHGPVGSTGADVRQTAPRACGRVRTSAVAGLPSPDCLWEANGQGLEPSGPGRGGSPAVVSETCSITVASVPHRAATNPPHARLETFLRAMTTYLLAILMVRKLA
jgi:hypothetical protein